MKKNYLKLCAAVFALALVTANFTGCFLFRKTHVAAIIRPTTEELTTERSKVEELVMKKYREWQEEGKEKEHDINSPKVYMGRHGFTTVQEVQKFYNEIEEVLSSRKDLRLVDRGRINDVLKEHGFQLSSFSDSNMVAEVGEALNADTLIYFESETPFPIDYPTNAIQNVRVEFFDVNTFTKKVVVVNKPEDSFMHPFMWRKSKKALIKFDID